MRAKRTILAAAAVASLTVVVSGCSLDTLIWGADGAAVIDTTERLVAAAAAGDAASFVCEGRDLDLGEPTDWEGLSAEEPETFAGEYWPEQAEHDPDWSINLSLTGERAVTGVEFPGDVFYRQTGDGLCLVDIAWWTVESVG